MALTLGPVVTEGMDQAARLACRIFGRSSGVAAGLIPKMIGLTRYSSSSHPLGGAFPLGLTEEEAGFGKDLAGCLAVARVGEPTAGDALEL